MMRVGICIPVCDPGPGFSHLIRSLQTQRSEICEVLILDSSPAQSIRCDTPPFRTYRVDPKEFDHGGTRNQAIRMLERADVIVFLTQDAVLASPTSVENLIACFDDPRVGAAYGRQLPKTGATEIERHARVFNYPPFSRIKSIDDIPRIGLKAAFISNSFAAYRLEALRVVGIFPEKSIVSEDTWVAARMILEGWKVAYCAEAEVFHSHAYTLTQEFQRYFDIGVFHAQNAWIRKAFSGAEGEGWRFAVSEIRYLLERDVFRVPAALIRTPVRYLGFRAGLLERHIPHDLKSRWSMQKNFWKTARNVRLKPAPSAVAPSVQPSKE